MNNKFAARAVAGLALALLSVGVSAKTTPDQAAKLGAALTPVGAESGANADGSIPAWTPMQQHGAMKGEYLDDPKLDAEKPLYTITKANMAQYDKLLTEGHKKLLNTYDTYKMNV